MKSETSSSASAPVEADVSTRDRVLDAARRLFLEKGYSATSAGAIGNEIGISGPALYWHFASKEEILFRLIERPLTAFVATIVSTEEEPSPRYADLVRRYARFQVAKENDLEGYSALVSIAEAGHLLKEEHRQRLSALNREVYDRFLAVLVEGAERGEFDLVDPVTTAFSVIAMCEHVQRWAKAQGRLRAEDIVEQCVALALRMAGAARS